MRFHFKMKWKFYVNRAWYVDGCLNLDSNEKEFPIKAKFPKGRNRGSSRPINSGKSNNKRSNNYSRTGNYPKGVKVQKKVNDKR